MSNKTELEVTKSHKQPAYETQDDAYARLTTNALCLAKNEVCLSISTNGFQSTGITIDVDMYDTLKALLEDYRVIEYMNSLRG